MVKCLIASGCAAWAALPFLLIAAAFRVIPVELTFYGVPIAFAGGAMFMSALFVRTLNQKK